MVCPAVIARFALNDLKPEILLLLGYQLVRTGIHKLKCRCPSYTS